MKLILKSKVVFLLLLLLVTVNFVTGQVLPINVGQVNGFREHLETLNQFSPKNHPAVSGNGNQLIRKSNDNIYLYGNDGFNNIGTTSFWVYNLTIKQWKCIQVKNLATSYGQKGVFSATNCPGNRLNSITFTDNLGNLYLFGGGGYNINDLWKYDIVLEQWAWISGYNDTTGVFGNLGPIGVASQNYFPAIRLNARTILATDGMVYLYGGVNSLNNSSKTMNLWRYNPTTNEWTLLTNKILPDNSSLPSQVVGQIGVEAPTNYPGYLLNFTCWFYNNSLWYYGGSQESSTSDSAVQKKVWKFNLATQLWVCMKNPTTVPGIFGQQLVSDSNNTPPSLQDISTATVINDEAYFIGGYELGGTSTTTNTFGLHNSLWKYDMLTNEWTWMKGTIFTNRPGFYGKKGIESVDNIPVCKRNTFLWNENGTIKTFGGRGTQGATVEFWDYNTTTNNFTWVDGKSLSFKLAYGAQNASYIDDPNVPSVFNLPGTNTTMKWGEKGSKFWYMTGYGSASAGVNGGMWEYDVATSTNYRIVEDIDHLGNYGQLGIPAATNIPPQRENGCTWETTTKLYLMSGIYNGVYYNDFWVFDKTTKQWTWINGAKNNETPLSQYGPIGVASTTNYPRSRREAITWVDEDENLWLFSGVNSDSYYLNDFWKYDTVNNTWILMGGSQNNCSATAPFFVDTYPPFLSLATAWSAGSNLFFYGGTTLIKSATSNSLTTGFSTDIWKYNIPSNTWSKVLGNRRKSNYANYGLQLYGFQSNRPGARTSFAHWQDDYGNLWLFGGTGRGEVGTTDNTLFDLWKFDISLNVWIWMDGLKNPLYYFDTYFNANDYKFPNRIINDAFTYRGGNGKYYLQMSDETNDLWEFNLESYPRDYNIIEGYARFDYDALCDPTDIGVSNLKLKINNIPDFQYYTNQAGFYKIYTPVSNNTLEQLGLVENTSFFTVTPTVATINFPGYNNVQLQDFCVSSNGIHNDLEVIIIPLTNARPGANNQYKVVYRNKGTTTLSGTIAFNYDEVLQNFISATLSPITTSSGQVSWDYTDLIPFETRFCIINLSLNGPLSLPPVVAGDIITTSAQINPVTNDETPLDNVFTTTQVVVNSFDPNDKTCLQGPLVSNTIIGEYVTYMIRFENTGTDVAQNIVVTDLIDTTKFYIESIETVDASHAYRKEVSDGNLVSYYFENINLPFPTSALRYGYVVFKIKTKNTLTQGDSFSNTAAIYFDYNAPIITNTYVTTIQNLGIIDNETQTKFILYPNPVKDMLFFETAAQVIKIEVFDVSGRILSSQGVINNKVNLNGLKTGNYILKITTENEVMYSKIIKE